MSTRDREVISYHTRPDASRSYWILGGWENETKVNYSNSHLFFFFFLFIYFLFLRFCYNSLSEKLLLLFVPSIPTKSIAACTRIIVYYSRAWERKRVINLSSAKVETLFKGQTGQSSQKKKQERQFGLSSLIFSLVSVIVDRQLRSIRSFKSFPSQRTFAFALTAINQSSKQDRQKAH